MGKITNEMVEYAYLVAKKVNRGELSQPGGASEISNNTGMNKGSAIGYIGAFLAMMEGRCYTRTINLYATKYYLECIGMDYGSAAQQKAAQSVIEHVKYYSTKNGNQNTAYDMAHKYV